MHINVLLPVLVSFNLVKLAHKSNYQTTMTYFIMTNLQHPFLYESSWGTYIHFF
jgi:hypothetical protein